MESRRRFREIDRRVSPSCINLEDSEKEEKKRENTRSYFLVYILPRHISTIFVIPFAKRSEITRGCWFALHARAVITVSGEFASHLDSPSASGLPHRTSEYRSVHTHCQERRKYKIADGFFTSHFIFRLSRFYNGSEYKKKRIIIPILFLRYFIFFSRLDSYDL